MTAIARRRFLTIAAAVGCGVSTRRLLAETPAETWRGSALGADSTIRIAGQDSHTARQLLAACRREIERAERLFSLYRTDSALRRLNREGELRRAPESLIELLSLCRTVHHATDGKFDPSIQPLWDVYSRWFEENDPADQRGPPDAGIREALSAVGFDAVAATRNTVAFRRPGMALTLNGIAQGYLTDRIGALLRAARVSSALVETGETLAVGRHPTGRPWRIGVQDPVAPGRLIRVMPLERMAMATSSPWGTAFDSAGRFHHLFDPSTGRCPRKHHSVTVCAPSAALADGLSTGFISLSRQRVAEIARSMKGVSVLIL